MPSPANAHCTGYEVFEVSSADTGGKLDLEEEEEGGGGGRGRGRGRREGEGEGEEGGKGGVASRHRHTALYWVYRTRRGL